MVCCLRLLSRTITPNRKRRTKKQVLRFHRINGGPLKRRHP